MLKKLFRHEFSYHIRLILISYAVLALYLLITRLAVEFSGYAISKDLFNVFTVSMLPTASLVGGAVLLFATVCILPLILGGVRFYRNLVSDEGYLTFTLPVTVSSHVFVKTMVPILYTLLSVFVSILLAGATIFIGNDLLPSFVGVITNLLSELSVGGQVYLWITLILLALSTLILAVISINFSIAVGQNFKKYRLGAAVLAYYITNSVLSFIKTMTTNTYYLFLDSSATELSVIHGLAFQVLLSVLILVPMYLYINHTFNKHLNLQ